jgi:excinuclease ABC subunit B
LIQTIGRAARHVKGRAILYADKITGSMQRALDETNRRREKQRAFNEAHGITPKGIKKSVTDIMEASYIGKRNKVAEQTPSYSHLSPQELTKQVAHLEKQMYLHAKNMEFELAAKVRDEYLLLKEQLVLKG